jgi:4-hydroxy-tetrahydrodipicolinate reductase
MGKMVESLAPEYGFTVHARVDLNDDYAAAEGADVAIEFTAPNMVAANVAQLASFGIPVVIGTTGWAEQMHQVKEAAEHGGIGVVWSPNFSIGVNVFFRLVREAAKMLEGHPQYGAWAWEIHHNTKKDAPSGTLIKLVEEMQAAGYTHRIDVGSNRAGSHPGTHEIGFDSGADTITLRHAARSREGFARGALKAAQWLPGHRGVFKFEDVLFERS